MTTYFFTIDPAYSDEFAGSVSMVASKTNDIDLHTALAEALESLRMASGMIAYFQTLPDGWLLADGSTYAKADYPALWEVTPASRKTATTFQVPDLLDRFVRGGASANATGGDDTHTLTQSEAGVWTSVAEETVGVPVPVLSPALFTMPHNNVPAYVSLIPGICT